MGSVALWAMACLTPALCDDRWIQVKSAHFLMFTPNGERQAKEAVEHFEQVRSFFLEASASKTAPSEVVRIVAFRGEKGYQPYQYNSGAIAFYLGTESQDFIVMRDLETQSYPIAVHEYTHLIVQHSGMKLPVWLNEGLADIYSTLEPHGSYVLIGRPLSGRVYSLTQTKWLPLAALFAVGQDSPYYNEREKMSIFYSESWLLADMLVRSPNYSGKFNALVAQLAAAHSTAEALASVYGKDLTAVMADMRTYFQENMAGRTILVTKFPVQLEKLAEEPEAEPASDLELRLTLADLLIGERKSEEAAAALTALSREYAQSPRVEEVWADMAWRQSRFPEMASHCRKAFALGSENAKLLVECAAVEMNQGVPRAEVIPVFERALKLDPHNDRARLQLAFLLLGEQKFGAALAQLAGIHSVKPDEASRFYQARGFAKERLGSEEEARKDLELAKKWAKNPADEAQAGRLLSDLDRAAGAQTASDEPAVALPQPRQTAPGDDPGSGKQAIRRGRPAAEAATVTEPESGDARLPWLRLPHASGLLTRIDCVGKTWQLHVTTAAGERVFVVAGASDVQMRDAAGEGSLTFACGEKMSRRVMVYYEARPGDPPLAGVAKFLDFVSQQ